MLLRLLAPVPEGLMEVLLAPGIVPGGGLPVSTSHQPLA